MAIHKRVISLSSNGPILVHCSAGVGRSGTFIALDIALEQANKDNFVDIPGIINRLREQRGKMVQSFVSMITLPLKYVVLLYCRNSMYLYMMLC